MDAQWAWATQSYYPGFCLTFVRDQDPAIVAGLLGGGPLAILTAEEADRVFPPSVPGSLLRCGTVPGWAYCYEDRAPVGFQPPLYQRLSVGSDVVQIVKGGDGMNIARRVVDGQQTEEFEPRNRPAYRNNGPAVLLARADRVLRDHPEAGGLLAALHAVSEHVGAIAPRDVLDGPLLTTFSTYSATDATTPITQLSHGLGRPIATFTATGRPVDKRGQRSSDRRSQPTRFVREFGREWWAPLTINGWQG